MSHSTPMIVFLEGEFVHKAILLKTHLSILVVSMGEMLMLSLRSDQFFFFFFFVQSHGIKRCSVVSKLVSTKGRSNQVRASSCNLTDTPHEEWYWVKNLAAKS